MSVTPPAVTIIMPLEGPLRIVVVESRDDDLRLLDWINAHEEYAALLLRAFHLVRAQQEAA